MLLQVGSPEVVGRVIHRELFSIGSTPVTLATLIAAAVVILATLGASILIQRAIRNGLQKRGKATPATVAISARLAHYVVLLIGFGISLQTIGLNLSALFTAGAFFAVALGFAMQNVAQNFVSGVILLTERTIKPGDILEVEGQVVKVTNMGLRATVVRSRDEEDLIIPNSLLVQNAVTNYTLRDSNFRLRAHVSVAYASDLTVVRTVLYETAESFADRSPAFEPAVLLTGFADSGVEFEVSVWIGDPWRARRILSELNFAIWFALQKHHITIPFPQRDVHMIAGG